jgi:Na+/proline symporter
MLAGHAVTPAELVVLQVAERLRQQLVADSVAEPAAALAEAVMPVAALVAATVVAAAMAAADTGKLHGFSQKARLLRQAGLFRCDCP